MCELTKQESGVRRCQSKKSRINKKTSKTKEKRRSMLGYSISCFVICSNIFSCHLYCVSVSSQRTRRKSEEEFSTMDTNFIQAEYWAIWNSLSSNLKHSTLFIDWISEQQSVAASDSDRQREKYTHMCYILIYSRACSEYLRQQLLHRVHAGRRVTEFLWLRGCTVAVRFFSWFPIRAF